MSKKKKKEEEIIPVFSTEKKKFHYLNLFIHFIFLCPKNLDHLESIWTKSCRIHFLPFFLLN